MLSPSLRHSADSLFLLYVVFPWCWQIFLFQRHTFFLGWAGAIKILLSIYIHISLHACVFNSQKNSPLIARKYHEAMWRLELPPLPVVFSFSFLLLLLFVFVHCLQHQTGCPAQFGLRCKCQPTTYKIEVVSFPGALMSVDWIIIQYYWVT